MIDSMILVHFSQYSQDKDLEDSQKVVSKRNPFVKWIVSAGRDHKFVVWKLFDGKIMHTDLTFKLYEAA